MQTQQRIDEMYQALNSAGIHQIIGFSGGSDAGDSLARVAVADAIQELSGKYVAILTGGTSFGVPKFATEEAKKRGLPVIGVYPVRGQKYALPDLDFAFPIEPRYSGSEWGDESEIFAKLANGVVLIGGGMGTMIEFSHIMKFNEARVKDKVEPVYVAPISLVGSSGRELSDLVQDLPVKREVFSKSIMNPSAKTGFAAARYLVEKLKLD